MALHISVARMLRCCSALLQGKADSSTNDNSFYYRILHVTEAARNRPVSPRIQMGTRPSLQKASAAAERQSAWRTSTSERAPARPADSGTMYLDSALQIPSTGKIRLVNTNPRISPVLTVSGGLLVQLQKDGRVPDVSIVFENDGTGLQIMLQGMILLFASSGKGLSAIHIIPPSPIFRELFSSKWNELSAFFSGLLLLLISNG